MQVTIGSTLYHVSFRNVSEKVVHDAMPASLRDALLQEGILETVLLPPHNRLHYRLRKAHRQYLRLKPPSRISTTTTHCSIAAADGTEIATGSAYFSKSEPAFNRAKARNKALGRALREFPTSFRDAFHRAYEHAWLEKIARATGRSAARTAASPDRDVTPPVPTQ